MVGLLELGRRNVAERARSLRSEIDARQPTIRRENMSMTNATYTNPRHVATYVRSATVPEPPDTLGFLMLVGEDCGANLGRERC
jgi:hypothetical protein